MEKLKRAEGVTNKGVFKNYDINNENYPDTLRDIQDPPRKLYVLGDVALLRKKSLAIVGARKCTEYGRKQGTKFSYNLAKEGITIVSGLAVRN